jgi:hypothetical protein
MKRPEDGQRIRLLGPMTNDGSPWMPVERGMNPGLEGTVVGSCFAGPERLHQIYVRWDNGRSLNVMPYVDRYVLLDAEQPGDCANNTGEKK